MTRKAFTLIEIMVAIVIITILGGLVLYALRGAGNSAKIHATRITLDNLKSLLAEFELKTKLSVPPPGGWLANVGYPGPLTSPAGADFWRNITGDANFALLNPELVGDTDPSSPRFSSTATNNTAIAMRELARIPANASVIGKMPAASLMQLNGLNVPVDSWGNPIIYVPARGLAAVIVGGNTLQITNGDPLPTGGIPAWIAINQAYVVGDHVFVTIGGTCTIYVATAAVPSTPSPGNPLPSTDTARWKPLRVRGFFASAGPDGNFAAGDDNLYSFEQ